MKALIVCNGYPPSKELLEEVSREADVLIGADGGGNLMQDRGISPDFVVGDMDSFEKPESVAFEIIHDPDQETNDLEKALKLALSRDVEHCIVVGAFGRRMDHSLKNLSVLKQFNGSFRSLVFKDDFQDCFIAGTHYRAEHPVGTVVSLVPLSERVEGITTRGLKYSLENEALILGKRDGSSNETVEDVFSVDIGEGDLLIFVERNP